MEIELSSADVWSRLEISLRPNGIKFLKDSGGTVVVMLMLASSVRLVVQVEDECNRV